MNKACRTGRCSAWRKVSGCREKRRRKRRGGGRRAETRRDATPCGGAERANQRNERWRWVKVIRPVFPAVAAKTEIRLSYVGALLRRWAKGLVATTFTELVVLHIDVDYTGGLRKVVGDAHLAQDVTEKVFADLGRRG